MYSMTSSERFHVVRRFLVLLDSDADLARNCGVNDGWMLQCPSRAHFAFKTPGILGASKGARSQYLYGHQLAQLSMARQEYAAHTALANRRNKS